jgi:hypothetical protein
VTLATVTATELPDVLIDEPAWSGWIGGGATRGQAIARFMEGAREAGYQFRFTDLCAHRVFGRLVPRGPSTKGWETKDFPDHFIEDCERTDEGATAYWEVTFA